MKVICILCKRPAEIPDVLLDILMEITDEPPDNMTFACTDCMATKTEKLAETFIDKFLYKNASQN